MGGPGLQQLPDDLFAHMQHLSFIHLGVHPRLTQLPRLDGLVNLKQMTLAFLTAVATLPSFAALAKLERLQFLVLPSLETLPDLAPLVALDTLLIFGSMQICCNGYLDARRSCDLSHPFCTATPSARIPNMTCLAASNRSDHATPATLSVLAKHTPSMCQGGVTRVDASVAREAVDMCHGKRFHACAMPTPLASDNTTERVVPGICVNLRMQVLACHLDEAFIRARRQQIQRGVGGACDPEVEAWLGCSST